MNSTNRRSWLGNSWRWNPHIRRLNHTNLKYFQILVNWGYPETNSHIYQGQNLGKSICYMKIFDCVEVSAPACVVQGPAMYTHWRATHHLPFPSVPYLFLWIWLPEITHLSRIMQYFCNWIICLVSPSKFTMLLHREEFPLLGIDFKARWDPNFYFISIPMPTASLYTRAMPGKWPKCSLRDGWILHR